MGTKIEEILDQTFDEFRSNNSLTARDHRWLIQSPTTMDVYATADPNLPRYPFSNEDYRSSEAHIQSNGGIYIGVSGSVDPAFFNISQHNPQLSILVDIDPKAIDYLQRRGDELAQNQNGETYWRSVLRNILNIQDEDPFQNQRADLYIEDLRNNGWSSRQDAYNAVKKLWQEGRIKGLEGDLVRCGLPVAARVSRETKIPITLIYVSNVPDYLTQQEIRDMQSQMSAFLDEGLIDRRTQVVYSELMDGSSLDPKTTDILEIGKYISRLGTLSDWDSLINETDPKKLEKYGYNWISNFAVGEAKRIYDMAQELGIDCRVAPAFTMGQDRQKIPNMIAVYVPQGITLEKVWSSMK